MADKAFNTGDTIRHKATGQITQVVDTVDYTFEISPAVYTNAVGSDRRRTVTPFKLWFWQDAGKFERVQVTVSC